MQLLFLKVKREMRTSTNHSSLHKKKNLIVIGRMAVKQRNKMQD